MKTNIYSISLIVLASMALSLAAYSAEVRNGPLPVYGEAGTNTIRVVIDGYDCVQPGVYYFKPGITLEQALKISGDLERNVFSQRVHLSHKGDNYKQEKIYRFRHLKNSEKAQVLLPDDRIFLSNGF